MTSYVQRARSGFERKLMARLEKEKIPYAYEAEAFQIVLEVPGYCRDCGSKAVARTSRYTPDFQFPVWTCEAKGKFTPRDRKRFLALIAGHPTRRFALCFQRDNWLSKKRKQRYSEWCEKRGIAYSVGWFKQEWLT